jgi:hypothetical protein
MITNVLTTLASIAAITAPAPAPACPSAEIQPDLVVAAVPHVPALMPWRAVGDALFVRPDGGVTRAPRVDAGDSDRAPPRVLFVGCNPVDQPVLALTREVSQIDRVLRGSSGDTFALAQHWGVRADELPGLVLRHRPSIVHVSGHGEPGALRFEAETGAADPGEPERVAAIFAVLNKYVRCVVLNACSSEAVARAIARHVDVVIAMTGLIADRDAIAFARGFYEAIGYGEDVGTAFRLAAAAVIRAYDSPPRNVELPATGDPAPAGAPILLARTGVDPSRLRFR